MPTLAAFQLYRPKGKYRYSPHVYIYGMEGNLKMCPL